MRQLDRRRRRHLLARLAVNEDEGRPKRLVATGGVLDRTGKPRTIDRAVKLHGRDDVVHRTIRLELIEEPQSPLLM